LSSESNATKGLGFWYRRFGAGETMSGFGMPGTRTPSRFGS
jgi:hypothetical protein